MTDLFCLGGTFDVYISMIGNIPQEATQSNYLKVFDCIFEHLQERKKSAIKANRIEISVYSDLLKKFVKIFGFDFKCLNPAKGKVYETSVEKLKLNAQFQKRYHMFANEIKYNYQQKSKPLVESVVCTAPIRVDYWL